MTRNAFILLLFAYMLLSLSVAVASTNAKTERVTLNLKNTSVKVFFEEIKKQTNLNFVYNAALTKKLKPITIQAKNEPVSSVLQRAFAGTEVSYLIEGDIITIRFQPKAVNRSEKEAYTLSLKLTDESGTEPLAMATCAVKSLGLFSVTDRDGLSFLRGLPPGTWTLEISYLGFESYIQTLTVSKNLLLQIKMRQTSLKLKDLSVVAAGSSAGVSSSSSIGRQAIDHLQATSLSDVMQLLPGSLMTNTDLTSKSNLQIRTLVNNSTNAFGASVIVDGVPISSNADLGIKGSFSETSFSGVDLRQVSADNIESVEVIRGIPSAEYGDLTSGAVIVNTKSGYTPWRARIKVNPSTRNYSLEKGFKLSKNKGVLNTNFDYVQAWGDPRKKTESFDRYTAAVAYTKDFYKIWRTTTKVSYSGLIDWSGNDPDQVSDGTSISEKNATITFNHNGKLSLNKPYSRVIKYAVGLSYSQYDYRVTKIVSNSTGFLPILTANETGYYEVPFEQASYKASGGSKSNPQNFYFKLSNSFYIRSEKSFQQFNTGVEFKNESNSGIGYYNDDDRYPLQPNNNGRPRAYSDIPALNQASVYFEDNLRFKIDDKPFKLQMGLRYTLLQPGKEEQTQSLSPRLNSSYSLFKWLDIRAGFGISSKTPGLIHLYPDKKYTDRIAANYIPTGDAVGQMVLYHTQVYDTQRTKGLKNASSYKYELGFDIKLPDQRKMSVIGYIDQTKNGFGSQTEYYTYTSNYYEKDNGLIVSSGNPTTVDWNHPARTDTVFASTGKIGNTNVSINKGVEIDMELGRIPAVQSSFYLTGAFMQTETYSTALNASDPSGLPTAYSVANTTPFKIVYPSGIQKTIYKQASTNLRMVSHVPSLRMIASLSTQVIWYAASYTTNQKVDPIGWIDTDLSYHEITTEMLDDPDYTIKGVLLSKQRRNPTDNPTTVNPVISLISARLTKELGSNSTFSFYANNFLYYEPFQHNNVTTTLTQKNEGLFAFGAELTFNF
jgi:outer membrane receptor for ferrienterochelin and colicin